MKISRIASVSVAVGLAAGLAVATTAPANGQVTAGTVYGLDWTSGVLSSIDPATGVMTPVYQTSPVIGGSAGMYVDPVSLKIIVPTYDSSPFPVFSVDPGAGSQAEVAAEGEEVTAAAGTPTQNYVAYDNGENDSQLGTMVSSTGAITDIAPLTLNSAPTRVSALAYCSGALYGFIYGEGEDVFTVNTTTGALTLALDTPGSVTTIYAADCNDEGTLFATDDTNLYKSSSVTTALSLVAPFSGPGFADFLETMAVAATGGAPAPAPLADTGFGVETAVITGLVAAALTAAGIVLVSRRRTRA